MAIENFDEVINYFEQNKDSDEVKNYVGGFISPDRVENFLNTDDGKKLLQPKLDKYHTKGLETFKVQTLPKLVDEQFKKLHPDADPKDSRIAELEAKFEAAQMESTRKDLKNSALKIATDKKLPIDLVDYFLGQDEDTTISNLNKLSEIFSKHDEEIKSEFAKGNSYTPPNGKKNTDLGDSAKLKEQIHNLMK